MDKKKSQLKRKQEDALFVRALLWALCTAIVFLLTVLASRHYINYSSSAASLAIAGVIATVLKISRIAAPVLFLLFLGLATQNFKKTGKLNPWISVAVAAITLAFFSHNVLLFQSAGIRLLYFMVPACGALAMAYYLYQRELFLCGGMAGLAAYCIWLIRHRGPASYLTLVASIAISAVVILFVVFLILKAKKNAGEAALLGHPVKLIYTDGGALLTILTAVFAIAAVAVAFLLGDPFSLYALFALAGWLFAMLVYFTIKLI